MTSLIWCFLFESHFEIHLQNKSVFYICRIASNLSVDKDFGVVFSVSVTAGIVASACGVKSLDEFCWAVLLLVLNAGPSECVADSMLIAVGLFWGNPTRHDRQSAALFHTPAMHSKVMLYVANSSPNLLTLLFAFCHWEILPKVCGYFWLLFQLL